MTGMFLAALEATVVGTAMPTVIAVLGGLKQYSWVFSAYLLTSTVTVPLWGKLSDLYGRKFLYQIGVGVFLLGSTLSGLATSMPQLIAFRAIQGLGAGALVPLAMTIVADIYTLEQRARMQGLFSGVWGLSSIVGPLIGGFITDQWSWRWIFFINLPVGILSAIIIGVAFPEHQRSGKPSIDYAGAATLTASMSLLMLALMETGVARSAWTMPILLGAAVVLFAIFLLVERRAREPLIPMQLFRNRVVSIGVLVGFLAGAGMFGAISFVPLFAQAIRGATATQAGSLLTPLMLSWVVMSIVGGRLLLRIGYRTMVVAGTLLLTASFLIFATFGPATPMWKLVVDLCLLGSGLGLTMLTLLMAIQHSVRRTQLGIATSLSQFSRSIGGAIGVAVMGVILSASMRNLDFDPNLILHAGPQTLPHVESLRLALASGLRNIFLFGGVTCAVALLGSFLLPGDQLVPVSAPRHRAQPGEELVMAELTTIDPEHEPVGAAPQSPRQ
jgi:EmrB/QacA subfamily drug resistance transporter